VLPKTGMKFRPCRGPQASWQDPTELELLLEASVCCLSAAAPAVLLPEEVSLLEQLDLQQQHQHQPPTGQGVGRLHSAGKEETTTEIIRSSRRTWPLPNVLLWTPHKH
jgi:hypothetical protein